MFNRKDNGGHIGHSWFLFVLVFVVVAVFLDRGQIGLKLPLLGAPQIAGLAVMILGLALVVAARKLAVKLPEERQAKATLFLKLGGVFTVGAGALIVFAQ